MRIQGSCPDCSSRLGVKVADAQAKLFGSAIKRYFDRDGNAVYCQTCGEYVEPEDNEIHEGE